jgi:hypothetical protein
MEGFSVQGSALCAGYGYWLKDDGTVWVADDGLPIRWEAASIGTVSEISCGSSSALSVSMLFFMHGHDTCVPPSDTTGYGTATNTDLSTASFDVTVVEPWSSKTAAGPTVTRSGCRESRCRPTSRATT